MRRKLYNQMLASSKISSAAYSLRIDYKICRGFISFSSMMQFFECESVPNCSCDLQRLHELQRGIKYVIRLHV